jgi:hypothetical protein
VALPVTEFLTMFTHKYATNWWLHTRVDVQHAFVHGITPPVYRDSKINQHN